MILHGEQIKIGNNILTLERSCTVTIQESATNTTGITGRTQKNIPLLRGWKVEAQFLFDWDTIDYILRTMRKGEKVRLFISGRAPWISTFTLVGDAYITRLGIPAQGRGIVTIPVTFQGTGKPSYTNVTENHQFRLNYSQLGEYTDPLHQPLI